MWAVRLVVMSGLVVGGLRDARAETLTARISGLAIESPGGWEIDSAGTTAAYDRITAGSLALGFRILDADELCSLTITEAATESGGAVTHEQLSIGGSTVDATVIVRELTEDRMLCVRGGGSVQLLINLQNPPSQFSWAIYQPMLQAVLAATEVRHEQSIAGVGLLGEVWLGGSTLRPSIDGASATYGARAGLDIVGIPKKSSLAFAIGFGGSVGGDNARYASIDLNLSAGIASQLGESWVYLLAIGGFDRTGNGTGGTSNFGAYVGPRAGVRVAAGGMIVDGSAMWSPWEIRGAAMISKALAEKSGGPPKTGFGVRAEVYRRDDATVLGLALALAAL